MKFVKRQPWEMLRAHLPVRPSIRNSLERFEIQFVGEMSLALGIENRPVALQPCLLELILEILVEVFLQELEALDEGLKVIEGLLGIRTVHGSPHGADE